MATQMITHGLHTDLSKQEPGMDCFVINKGLITPCRDVNNSVHFKNIISPDFSSRTSYSHNNKLIKDII